MSSLTWPHPHFTGKENDLLTSFTAVCSAVLYSAGPITASRVLLASFPGLHSEVFCVMDADIKISNKKLQVMKQVWTVSSVLSVFARYFAALPLTQMFLCNKQLQWKLPNFSLIPRFSHTYDKEGLVFWVTFLVTWGGATLWSELVPVRVLPFQCLHISQVGMHSWN